MDDSNVLYNQVRQKSSHNSYERNEGYSDQALYWRIRSLEIDIHNCGPTVCDWPQLTGNWYVYHSENDTDPKTSVNTLQDALKVLMAFHQAVPDHEVVTIWLDLKNSISVNNQNNQTPADLDALLSSELGRDLIWGPPDLISDADNLQQAISENGWPTLEALRGKFIFACTGGGIADSDSVLNQYVESGNTATQRLCFIAPSISLNSEINTYNYAVFFNLKGSPETCAFAKDIYDAGFVSRIWCIDNEGQWTSACNSKTHHLATNKINSDKDSWARTDIHATGYPFTGIDVTLDDDLTEPGTLYAIKVTSGNLGSTEDNLYFQYSEFSDALVSSVTSFIAGPQLGSDDATETGFMFRSSLTEGAAYVALLQSASNSIKLMYRTAVGETAIAETLTIPNGVNNDPEFEGKSIIWLGLYVDPSFQNFFPGYSVDGVNWNKILNVAVHTDICLAYGGWFAASDTSDSDSTGSVKCLFGGTSAPANSVAIGDVSGSFISDSAAAASLDS